MLGKNDPRYGKCVKDFGREYDINTKVLATDEWVECPHDSDMFVKRDEQGAVIIKKKSYSDNPFHS